MEIIEGSLINQVLKDGSLFGGDYDGRLGPLTHFFNIYPKIVTGKTVLDLGSNAGHFPIEYIRAGAKKVYAVEGRPEFENQWAKLKNQVYGVDTSRIDWKTADIKDLYPNYDYSVLSCLGLIYHMYEPWEILIRLAKNVDTIILESQVYEKYMEYTEHAINNTQALSRQKTEIYTIDGLEEKLKECFPNFIVSRMWGITYGDLEKDEANGDPQNAYYFCHATMRGLWILWR